MPNQPRQKRNEQKDCPCSGSLSPLGHSRLSRLSSERFWKFRALPPARRAAVGAGASPRRLVAFEVSPVEHRDGPVRCRSFVFGG